MSYNFDNGMPSATMARPWRQVGYVDPMQQFGNGQFSSMGNYGIPEPSDNNPLIPQMSVAPLAPKLDLSSAALANMPSTGGPTNPATGGGLMDWFFGKGTRDAPGNIGSVIGVGSALASAFMGMKQYGLAKDTLAQNKEAFQKQYDANRQMTNASLSDRQAARVASNPGAYQSVGDYMNRNGIKA